MMGSHKQYMYMYIHVYAAHIFLAHNITYSVQRVLGSIWVHRREAGHTHPVFFEMGGVTSDKMEGEGRTVGEKETASKY